MRERWRCWIERGREGGKEGETLEERWESGRQRKAGMKGRERGDAGRKVEDWEVKDAGRRGRYRGRERCWKEEGREGGREMLERKEKRGIGEMLEGEGRKRKREVLGCWSKRGIERGRDAGRKGIDRLER